MIRWLIILMIFSTVNIYSFKRKAEEVESFSMNKKIPVTVILPDTYTENKKYAVIYGLHGWGGSFRTFGKVRRIAKLADELDIILVFPDGKWNSWYIDSEIKENSRHSTFISKELVQYIDKKYSTYAERSKRALTGFSMGGFGAFYNGLRNEEIFGNIGSISGGFNIEKFQNKWGIKKVVNENWQEYNIKDILNSKGKVFENTNIRIDCGNKDFFLESNREVHEKLKEMGILHEYSEGEGKHNKKFWEKIIAEHIQYFSEKFKESREEKK